MINWNLKNWIIIQTPPERVNDFFTAFMQAMLAPIESLFTKFKAYSVNYLDEIKVNGQSIVLAEFLNRRFDAVDKRIRIETLSDSRTLLIFADENLNKPVIFGTQIFVNQALYQQVYDFDVIVPNSVLTALQVQQLKDFINRFRIAGTRPRFRQENGTII